MSRASFDTLPSEVKIRIFSRLPFCERVRLTQISKTWRHFLLHWPGMFEKIENRCMCSFASDPKRLGYSACDLPRALLPYAPYIQPTAFRELVLIVLKDATLEQTNAELENTFYFFAALRCYYIQKCFLSVDAMDMIWFLKFLQVTARRMTCLKMFYRQRTGTSEPILDLILVGLPCLKRLQFTLLPASDETLPSSIFAAANTDFDLNIHPQHPMTDLELDCEGSGLNMPLDNFVLRLPDLQHVILNEADFRDPSRVLEFLNTCPDLRTVVVDRYQTRIETPPRKPNADGLYHLELSGSFSRAGSFCPLVAKHHRTLETLILGREAFSLEAMSLFASLDFPRLQKLVLTDETFRLRNRNRDSDLDDQDEGSSDVLAEKLETLLHKLPLLQCLEIVAYHVITDRMLQALETVPCLEKLQITMCSGVSEQGLLRFLDNTRSKDCLNHVELADMPCVSNKVLHQLGRKLTALKHLGVTDETNISLFDGLDRFLATSPIIGTLKFLDIDCNKDDDFVPTDEQVDAVLRKIKPKIMTWHFGLNTPSKQRAKISGFEWWYQNVYKPEHPDEDDRTRTNDTNDSSVRGN